MWEFNFKGEKEFKGSKNDWTVTEKIAMKCSHFIIDDEDELVSDNLISCYNCRYRRWTSKSFTCMFF